MFGDKMFYKIKNGSIEIDGNLILENINFSIREKEKIGLIGQNGSGKTTLLKAIIGQIPIEDGYEPVKIESSKDFKIGYVEQSVKNQDSILMIDYIKESYQEIIKLSQKIEQLEQELAKYYDEKNLEKYQYLLDKFQNLGGYYYQKEYENALLKFGFGEKDKNKYLSEFSGGQRTKLSLLRLLLSKPDLLILDEPTNHLDIESITWLEEYLKNYPKALIVVSHDRMFLDNICNVIDEIEYGTLKRYSGNYTAFVKQKEMNEEKAWKDFEKQEKEIKRLTEIVNRFRYKPTKAKMAMSKLKQIERIRKLEKPPISSQKTFPPKLKIEEKSYQDVLKVKNLTIGYTYALGTFNFQLFRGDKLGIIGENGTGKSTLVKTLLGEIPPLSGKFHFGERTTIGYFSQNFDNLDDNCTLYEEMNRTFPNMPVDKIRKELGSFGFSGEAIKKKIEDLSGGEKVRISLCKIINQHPNVLLLDEPTNHLDMQSKSTIEKILQNYSGTILLISHDRYLIQKIANKLLVLKKNNFQFYQLDYNTYLEQQKLNEQNTKLVFSPQKEKIKVKKTTNINQLENKRKKLEKEIEQLEQQKQEQNQQLFLEENYLDGKKMKIIDEKIVDLTNKITKKNKEWEEIVQLLIQE